EFCDDTRGAYNDRPRPFPGPEMSETGKFLACRGMPATFSGRPTDSGDNLMRRLVIVGVSLVLAACSPSSGNDAGSFPPPSGMPVAVPSTGGGGAGAAFPTGSVNAGAPSTGGSFFGPVGMQHPPDPNAPDGSCGATRARAEQVVIP